MILQPLLLTLEFSRAEETADPYGFRFAPQDYILRTASGDYRRAHLQWDQALIEDLNALRLPRRDPVVLQRLGETLRSFLEPLGWESLATQILEASRQERRVLLTIRSAAAELYALPWELLTFKATGQHVGELPEVLLRYEWPGTTTSPEKPTPRHGGGRILLAWSGAGGAVPASEHANAIAAACQIGSHPFEPLRDTLAHASLSRLSETLAAAQRDNQPISGLCILAHGGVAGSTFGLVLDNEGTGSVVVDAGRLRQILAPYAHMVRLVVVMACDSSNVGALGNQLGSVAQTLHRAGIASVVASCYPLSVVGSVQLAEVLYRRLLQGPDSLESALLTSRAALAQDARFLDWASIQLYARAADGEDTRPLVFRPYQGLASFGVEQRRFFFGRQALTERLWLRCQTLFLEPGATRLLAILGPSGSGKSSVARAGLLAELKQRPQPFSERIAIVRPGDHPQRALERALAEFPSTTSEPALLLLVDQFEEVDTLCTDKQERDVFVKQLLDTASDSTRHISVVLTLSSDFLGETHRQHPELNRLFGEQSVLATAMSPEELRQAIVEPAARAGRPLDEAIVEQLLLEARGADGTLPLLEFALARVWEGMLAGKEPVVTLREIGGVGGALAGRAQEIYDALSPPEQETARRALVRLVRLGEGTRDTRRRASIVELCGRGETEDSVLSVLRKFSSEHARLITLGGQGAEATAEVTHEALFDHWTELRTWIEQSRKDRDLYDQALEWAKRWTQAGRPAGSLWRPPDLDRLRDYQRRKPEDLGLLLTEFLNASEGQHRRERTLRRRTAIAVLGALLAAVVVYIVKERQQAQAVHGKLLDSYVERGAQLLSETGRFSEAVLWLHRAQAEGSRDSTLPDMLKSAMQSVDATKAVLIGHRGVVWNATFSPDGHHIITVSQDKTARLWDAERGRPLVVFSGDGGGIQRAIFSSDGHRIVTVSEDNTAQVWNAENRQLVAKLKGHGANILSVRFSPDSRRVVTASVDRTARVWDAESGQLVAELKGHEAAVWSATFSPDSRRIVTASEDKTARLWDAESGQPLAEPLRHTAGVKTAMFSPDGGRIVTVSDDQTARAWGSDGRPLTEFKSQKGTVLSMTFSPEGHRIVTLDQDHTARVWHIDTGLPIAELKGHGDVIVSATFSPDGRRIVTASLDHTARVWDAQPGRLLAELRGHGDLVLSAMFSPDGRRIVTASYDGTARVWDAESNRLIAEFQRRGTFVRGGTFSRDGHRIITVGEDKTARVWDAESGQYLPGLKGLVGNIITVTFSPDGRRLVAVSEDKTGRVWDVESGRLLAELHGHSAADWGMTFSPDGSRIVTTSGDKTARVWKTDSGEPLPELSGHEANVWSATFSPDGRRIVTASKDKTARVWDAGSGQLLTELKGHRDGVWSATFSPDGRRIVTASDDKTARLWKAESGELIAELKGHRDSVWSATFSPDGHRIVTASDDKTARLWDAENGRLLAELKGHSDKVTDAMFSPDGHRIVTASDDYTARVWDAENRRLLAELKGHLGSVRSAIFSRDGHRIVTASNDNTVRLWDLSPETRTSEQIAKLIRCYVPAHFEPEGSSVIVFRMPTPTECQPPPPPQSN